MVNENSFAIVDKILTSLELVLKETMYIKWSIPVLNTTLHFESIDLVFSLAYLSRISFVVFSKRTLMYH